MLGGCLTFSGISSGTATEDETQLGVAGDAIVASVLLGDAVLGLSAIATSGGVVALILADLWFSGYWAEEAGGESVDSGVVDD